MSPPVSTPLVVVAAEELARIVRDAVDAALDDRDQESAPDRLLVSGAELATMLGCSRSKIHALRLTGMPTVRLGDTYRFEPARALEFLRSRS